ncbi:hypothetical protein [Bradyrhizobium centrolobii]|uniref:hypothetical protein n=1 Tax=Bradyrhizobium centrolobii TaxID=1505087 RepID=UPI0010A975AD|nr:hypothetical protein [Bradyrhizobium centrolobii]
MAAIDSVAIVGADSVGRVTALGLTQAEVPVAIGRETVFTPRAITYHWSALEGLSRLGLLEDALALGFAKQDYADLA